MLPMIMCGGATGRAVVFGWHDGETLPQAETVIVLHRARMILYWPATCGGILGLAANGPQDGLRLTSAVKSVSDTARQVLSVSASAAAALDRWPDA